MNTKTWSDRSVEDRLLVVQRRFDHISTEDWLLKATPREILDMARNALSAALTDRKPLMHCRTEVEDGNVKYWTL